MPKRYLDGNVKIEKNIFHEYHKVIDPQTGQIDQTDFRVCKCRHCSIWTPEILKAHDDSQMFRLPAFYGGSKN